MRSLSSLLRAGMTGHPTLGTLGALVLSAATAAAALPGPHPAPEAVVPHHGKHLVQKHFEPAGLRTREVQVMVELADPPAIKVFSEARNRRGLSVEAAHAEAETQAASLRKTHKQIRKALRKKEINASVLFSVEHAYNGIAVVVLPGNIERIRQIPGVKAVIGLTPKTRLAHDSVDFIDTPSFWNMASNGGLDYHGEGMKIGLIDSGIDYIHTDFGGPGTSAAYTANASETTVDNQFFPNTIVAGGYDFAGDAYDPDPGDTGYNPIPHPDPNPFDSPDPASEGHGTGTASIAAGRGVNADGTTYTGPYDSTTPLASMLVSPGIAPAASIYEYRVFGNFGATELEVQAIDQAVQDGVDVLSISIGADNDNADDPVAVALDNASEAGIVCCCAAGNAGDVYYVSGAPADSLRAISVAASYNNEETTPVAQGHKPEPIAGTFFAFNAGVDANGSPVPPSLTATPLTGDVVYAVPHTGYPANTDGTYPPLDNAAQISGHVCLIDRGTISFYVKVAEAQAAGATAVLIADNRAEGPFFPIVTGTPLNGTAFAPDIPTGGISQADGTTLEGYLDPNGTDEGALTDPTDPTSARTGPENISLFLVSVPDTIPYYTSRGPRRPDGLLKPDVTAPAEAVDVSEHLSGHGSMTFNGTSSATPHVAGAMTLMKHEHPTWTVEQLKALVMNTASHDLVTTDIGPGGIPYGPGRIGNGRIDLDPASKATVIAYDADPTTPHTGAVSVSFGPVDVPIDGTAAFTATRTVAVVNTSATAQTFNVSFVSVGTDVPGVTFTVPDMVTVPGTTTTGSTTTNGSTTLDVTLNADPATMLHTHDPTVAETVNIPEGSSTLTEDREWKSEATGYLVLTPSTAGATPIRLVVHAMPRPVSTRHATTASLPLPAASGTVDIALGGTGVDNVDNVTASGEAGIFSLLKIMELQYTGPFIDDGSDDASAQLEYVGVSSDYAAEGDLGYTVLNFGIAAYGDYAAPDAFTTEYDILIDTTGGSTFTPNYVLTNYLLTYTDPTYGVVTYYNVYVPLIQNLSTQTAGADYFTNGISSTGVDTNIFNTNVMTMPVAASDLGIADGDNPVMHYQVVASYNNLTISETPVLTYDMTNPGLVEPAPDTDPTLNAYGAAGAGGGYEPFLDHDYGDGGKRTLAYSNANLRANRSFGALLLHFHNGSGARADAVMTGLPEISGFSPAAGLVGTTVTITGVNLDTVTNVQFFNGVDAASFTASVDGTSLTATVPAGAQTGVIRLTSPAGAATTLTKFIVALTIP